MFGSRFSIFGSGAASAADKVEKSAKSDVFPGLKLRSDKDVYWPGDPVVVTIEISSSVPPYDCSLFIERLRFEIIGLQKLDAQWFSTQKPIPGSKQRRGERIFMDCSVQSIVSNQIISSGATKSYVVRTTLPSRIPPSYKGATIRYMYYVKSTLLGRWLIQENGRSRKESLKDQIEMEARVPLQVWVTQKISGMLMEEGQNDAFQMDVFWKEMEGDTDWVRANDIYDGIDEGYESSRDEISSVSSYNPMREPFHRTFGSSLSFQSSAAKSGRFSMKDSPFTEGERLSLSSNVAHPGLSVAEVLYDSADGTSPQKSSAVGSQALNFEKNQSKDDDAGVPSSPRPKTNEPVASEGFIRGRSYNIRVDDQVLLRFCPKNSDSTYYFSDMIGGTLTFFHEEGARRCLEVSIALETSETVSRRFVHPSRRNSPTIVKVQSDHYEVVADLIQTSFLFSIPMDGPMSFSTPHVSLQWALRFEFFTTPKNVDWTRYEHPLMIEGREKSEWILPINVHAPPSSSAAAQNRNERSFSLDPLWMHS
ncbi:uncharacterized protein LOC111778917 [Cucurbita pepo subsp. pepo]|uniref:uncharacterized protein LOC111778917 n=1 Tax=Cucurbita pepo subsp. pepo TaxID=3664 RepID=UPI000C9DA658|nr:uncharacterized protein LOC111778917 [Cucurbita pepo subsp. pepo]